MGHSDDLASGNAADKRCRDSHDEFRLATLIGCIWTMVSPQAVSALQPFSLQTVLSHRFPWGPLEAPGLASIRGRLAQPLAATRRWPALAPRRWHCRQWSGGGLGAPSSPQGATRRSTMEVPERHSRRKMTRTARIRTEYLPDAAVSGKSVCHLGAKTINPTR